MANVVELANSYYRLFRWVENAAIEKKAPALRALERIKRFLTESGVEIIDLTEQPFNEGWAVKVLKIDEGVPENELVFSRMVKPIIQINGDLVQEGEVYVGKATPATIPQSENSTDNTLSDTEKEHIVKQLGPTKHPTIAMQIEKLREIIAKVPFKLQLWPTIIGSVAMLCVVIFLVCTGVKHAELKNDIIELERQVESLSMTGHTIPLGDTVVVTYELRHGDETILVTQPINEPIVSTVEINGSLLSITTTLNSTATEGD